MSKYYLFEKYFFLIAYDPSLFYSDIIIQKRISVTISKNKEIDDYFTKLWRYICFFFLIYHMSEDISIS